MKPIIFALALAAFSLIVNGQTFIMERVPAQLSVETGYQKILTNTYSSFASNGYTVQVDYAWQLGGLAFKKPVYLSIPLGYTFFFRNNNENNSLSFLTYGWTVRHELLRDKKFIPFIAYSLELNQLTPKNYSGQVIGHLTKFEIGMNHHFSNTLCGFIKLEYSYGRFPRLGETKSNHIQTIAIKSGIRFNKKPLYATK